MKRSVLKLCGAIIAALAASCTISEMPESGSEFSDSVIARALKPQCKVAWSEDQDRNLYGDWQTGDVLFGFTSEGSVISYSVEAIDNDGTAKLRQTTSVSLSEGDEVYLIHCPGKTASDLNGSSLAVDFSSQPKDVVPVLLLSKAAVSDGTLTFTFTSACSVLTVSNPVIQTSRDRRVDGVVLSGRDIVSSGKVVLTGGELEFVPDSPSSFIVKATAFNTSDGSFPAPVRIVLPPCEVEDVTVVTSSFIYQYHVGRTAESGCHYGIDGKTFTSKALPRSSEVNCGGVEWAARNLGAAPDSEKEALGSWGDIFKWGENKIIYSAKGSSTITFDATHNGGFTATSGEALWDGSAYLKYNSADGKTRLESVDDPVQLAYPGTGWRMPTADEFSSLDAAASAGTLSATRGSKSSTFTDASGNTLEIQRNAKVCNSGTDYSKYGRYWVSDLDPEDATKATYFNIGQELISKKTSARYSGYSIRPVRASAGKPDDPDEPDLPNLNKGKSVAGFPSWTEISINYSQLTSSNHPRLFLRNKDIKAIRKQVADGSNPYLKMIHDEMLRAAKSMSSEKNYEKPLKYELDDSETRLLQVSRKAIHRIVDLAYAYRITGEEKYLEMAEWNMKCVCEFDDWHPSHYLDVGEMAVAVAIGYDWLYADLTDEVRTLAAVKLRDYALRTAEGKAYHRTGNWNQVCLGGLMCAALACYETCPGIADEVIRKSLESNAKQVKAIYSPDGVFPEGPGYWEYGTTYQGVLNLAAQTALGTDFELPSIEGFAKSGDFYVFNRGNSDKRFNYSDSGEQVEASFGLWYMAYRFGKPEYLYNYLRFFNDDTYYHEYYSFLALVCSYLMGPVDIKAPGGRLFCGAGQNQVLMCRSGWDSDDLYLALKGGTSQMSHAHMDIGEVVFDAFGTRWFKDFTYSTNYTELENIFIGMGLPGDAWGDWGAGSWRWKILQFNNRSHSTLTINDTNQYVSGYSNIYRQYDEKGKLGGTVDLLPPYYNVVAAASRTALIKDDSYLEIFDEIKAPAGVVDHVRFTCASDAAPTIVADGILLYDGKTTMKLQSDAPGAVYKIWSVNPSDYPEGKEIPGQDPLEGYLCGYEYDVPAGTYMGITTTLIRK